MKRETYVFISILAIISMANHVIHAGPSTYAGVCYGTLGNDLPPPSEVISLLKNCGIAKFRIYEPQSEILQENTQLVSLTIRNQDLETLASSVDAARDWVNINYVPYNNILDIVVGNEVVPDENARYVAQAMANIRSAVSETDKPDVSVTTSISSAALTNTYPPSNSVFTSEAAEIMDGIVKTIRNFPPERRSLYVNVYPYFAYASDPTHISLDFALFRENKTSLMDVDLEYQNLFDAMFDSYVWALEKIGGGDIGLVVGETGWPSAGNGDVTTPSLASTYNTNLYNHLVNNRGSPKRPNDGFSDFYIFAMFNENQKPEGVEQNWGLFYPNMEHVYPTPIC